MALKFSEIFTLLYNEYKLKAELFLGISPIHLRNK